jgi:steroid delta-isomerase-like uncharacterized protein
MTKVNIICIDAMYHLPLREGFETGDCQDGTFRTTPSDTTKEKTPMPEGKPAVEGATQAFAEIVTEQEYDRLPSLLAEDFVWRIPAAPDGPVKRVDDAREVRERMNGGFPDFRAEPGDVFVEGNEGIAPVRFTGTHEGEFMEIPPTGQEIELTGMTKGRVVDGELQEQHDVANMQTLLAQVSVAEG